MMLMSFHIHKFALWSYYYYCLQRTINYGIGILFIGAIFIRIFVKIFQVFQLLEWEKGRLTQWQLDYSKNATFFLCGKESKLKGTYALSESHFDNTGKLADVSNVAAFIIFTQLICFVLLRSNSPLSGLTRMFC